MFVPGAAVLSLVTALAAVGGDGWAAGHLGHPETDSDGVFALGFAIKELEGCADVLEFEHVAEQICGRDLTGPEELDGAHHVVAVCASTDVDTAHRNPVTDEALDRLSILQAADDHRPSSAHHLHGLHHRLGGARRSIDHHVNALPAGQLL